MTWAEPYRISQCSSYTDSSGSDEEISEKSIWFDFPMLFKIMCGWYVVGNKCFGSGCDFGFLTIRQ